MSVAEGIFVTRTMLALEVLTFQPASAPQVAEALSVHPRTARRLLNRLVEDGWVTRSDAAIRIYAPTMRLAALAAQLVDRAPLATAARPLVTRLHDDTGGVAHLAVPSYRSVLCVVHRASGPDARPQLRELVPAHATATGKVLLAYRDPWRESFLERELTALTPRTITDPERFREEAAAIRARGHATESGEFIAGVDGVAVPVRAEDAVVASLGLSFPVSGLDAPALVERLSAAARDIERRITQPA